MSLDMPFYNIAFPKLTIDANGIASIGGDVVPSNMAPISEATHGCYFEPIPPYPHLPELPPAPSVTDDPEELDDDVVKNYTLDLLSVLQLLIENDPDANFSTFDTVINATLAEDSKVSTAQEFYDLTLDDSIFDDDVVSELDWDAFNTAMAATTQAAMETVTEDDLNAFYNQQMGNMFEKIRTSLKRQYRMTFISPNQKLDGTLRDIKVQISYTTHVNYMPTSLTGEATGRFVAPLVADEDLIITQKSSIDPASPIYNPLFGGGAAPRDGVWLGPTEIKWGVELLARAEDGEPWLLATMTADGDITVNDDPASPFDSVDEADVTTYLKHVELQVSVDGPELTQKMVAFIPTCIASDRAAPQDDWPLGNTSAVGFRQSPLWYRVQPVATRRYSFIKKIPSLVSGSVVVTNVADEADLKEDFPPLVTYIYDSTAPTISLFVCPSRGEVNRLEGLEIDLDSETRPRPMQMAVYGKQWHPAQNFEYEGFVANMAEGKIENVDWPLSLTDIDGNPGPSTDGLYVFEGQRLELYVRCRDNFDKAKDLSYMSDPDTLPAPHNDYENSDMYREENGFDHWPFLTLVEQSAVEDGPGFAAVIKDDGNETPLGPNHIFRTANYPDGPERSIIVQASDEAGNKSSIEVPIFVMPLGFKSKQLEWQSKRNN